MLQIKKKKAVSCYLLCLVPKQCIFKVSSTLSICILKWRTKRRILRIRCCKSVSKEAFCTSIAILATTGQFAKGSTKTTTVISCIASTNAVQFSTAVSKKHIWNFVPWPQVLLSYEFVSVCTQSGTEKQLRLTCVNVG